MVREERKRLEARVAELERLLQGRDAIIAEFKNGVSYLVLALDKVRGL